MGEGLPLDKSHVLHVSVPFCGGFSEVPLLLPTLRNHFLQKDRARTVRIFGCDLDLNRFSPWWATFMEWRQREMDPMIELYLDERDLEAFTLPPAALIIGVHPGPDLEEKCWNRILQNILRSLLPGGR